MDKLSLHVIQVDAKASEAVPANEFINVNEAVNFNIQNFKGGAGAIENMGIDNAEQIRKNVAIVKAPARPEPEASPAPREPAEEVTEENAAEEETESSEQ